MISVNLNISLFCLQIDVKEMDLTLNYLKNTFFEKSFHFTTIDLMNEAYSYIIVKTEQTLRLNCVTWTSLRNACTIEIFSDEMKSMCDTVIPQIHHFYVA